MFRQTPTPPPPAPEQQVACHERLRPHYQPIHMETGPQSRSIRIQYGPQSMPTPAKAFFELAAIWICVPPT